MLSSRFDKWAKHGRHSTDALCLSLLCSILLSQISMSPWLVEQSLSCVKKMKSKSNQTEKIKSVSKVLMEMQTKRTILHLSLQIISHAAVVN